MTVIELITELRKCPNGQARIVIYDPLLCYSFQHASIKRITVENEGETVYLRIKNE